MDKDKKLKGISDTLYIPLAARIYVSEKFPHFFYDEKALSLKPSLPIDVIDKNSSEYFYMAGVCRQERIDRKIRIFLKEHQRANIVFLGAGLETACNRLKNQSARFYQVDLGEVIEIRKRTLGNAENEKLLKGDMFDLAWIKEIDRSLPTLICVAGVYQYFHEEKIIDMIQKMKASLPKAELLFDAINSKGLALANKYVKKTGNKDAQMYFSVDNPAEFAGKTGTKLLEVEGFFAGALQKCHGLKLTTRIYMYFADRLHRTLLIHLAF